MDTSTVNVRLDEPSEFNLTLALVEVLRRIKGVLIFALIFALVLGLLKWRISLKDRQELLDEQAQIAQEGDSGGDLSPEELETRRIERETYRAQKASYESQITAAQTQIAQKEADKEKSVLLSVDLNDFRQRGGLWYIDTHYQIRTDIVQQDPNPTGSVVAAYQSLLSSGEFYTYVDQQMTEKVDAQYLAELIDIVTDPASATLSVSVFGNSEQMAREIYTAAKAYLTSHSAQIKSSVHSHDLALVNEWDGSVTGEQAERVREAQSAYNSEVAELRAMVSDLQSKLLTLKVPTSLQTTVIENSILSDTEIAINAAIFGLIGLLLGVVLAAIVIIFRFVKRDAALDEGEIARRNGLFVLASVRRFGGEGRWQRMLSRMCGDERRAASVEAAAPLAKANLISALETLGRPGEKVLLVGCADGLGELAKLLDTDGAVAAGGDVMRDSTAADTLRGYDNVVLAERKEDVSYRQLNLEIDQLLLLKKNVLGLIAL